LGWFRQKKHKSDDLFLANKIAWCGVWQLDLRCGGTNVGPFHAELLMPAAAMKSGIVAGNFSWYAFPFYFDAGFVFCASVFGLQK